MTGAEIVTAIVAALPIIERIFRKVWETQDDKAMAWAFISSHLQTEVADALKPYFDSAWDIFKDDEVEFAWQFLKAELARGNHLTRATIPNLDADAQHMHDAADEETDAVPPHRRDAGGFTAPDPFDTEPPAAPPTLRPEDLLDS